MASPTFVGRVDELQTLEAARRRAADGEPAVVLVGASRREQDPPDRRTNPRCAADGNGCLPIRRRRERRWLETQRLTVRP